MSTTETKVRHTPGPWRVCEFDNHTLLITQEIGLMNVAKIAWIDGRTDEPQLIDERNRADADLIAAAPDMLEALEEGERELSEFFATYVTNGVGVDDGTSNVLQKAAEGYRPRQRRCVISLIAHPSKEGLARFAGRDLGNVSIEGFRG